MGLFAGTPYDLPPRCERCEKLESECTCPPEAPPQIPPEQQTAKLAIEKRQKGKMVTVIRGLADEHGQLPELFTKLKGTCGAGGSLHAGVIEIQGQHLDRIRETLTKLGYRVRG